MDIHKLQHTFALTNIFELLNACEWENYLLSERVVMEHKISQRRHSNISLRGQETQSSVIQYGATGGYYVSYNHTNHTNHTQPSTETREIVRDGARWQSLSGDTWFPNKKKGGGLGLAS